MLERRAATSLSYGSTGTYKTHNIGLFARYQYEKTGKPIRLISADSGGWEPIQEYIEAGIIHPLHVAECPDLLGLLVQLCRGYWPDTKGQMVKGEQNGIENISGYAVEGVTTIAQLLMMHFAMKGQKINEDVVGMFTEAGIKFGANPRSHYGFIPQQVYGMLTDLGTLPVERVLITAHEGKGQDEFSKQLVYGPAAVGLAATNRIPPYVGDLLHYDTVEAVVGGQKTTEVRAYFKSHPDPVTRVLWPSKVRLNPSMIPALNEKWPDGYITLELERGIDQYFRFQDEQKGKSLEKISKFKSEVDSLKATATN